MRRVGAGLDLLKEHSRGGAGEVVYGLSYNGDWRPQSGGKPEVIEAEKSDI